MVEEKMTKWGYSLLLVGFFEILIFYIFYIFGTAIGEWMGYVSLAGMSMGGLMLITGIVLIVITIIPRKNKNEKPRL